MIYNTSQGIYSTDEEVCHSEGNQHVIELRIMLNEVEFCPTEEVIFYTSEGKYSTEVERKLSEEGFCFTTVDLKLENEYFF
ncbi:hypothetical protein [Chryseobacterium luquanense]|uniref:Uncharacterized protein n=1 Tax=Chryseobacterium luquanense TaxID=2983766 RepID=A0ABT3Y1S4_9FLAO|nr:hypothetical protein [Chryseobacterium luquanense]MCX8532090.1 hypothetical protein [Chryseobacterium luquanense]